MSGLPAPRHAGLAARVLRPALRLPPLAGPSVRHPRFRVCAVPPCSFRYPRRLVSL